MNSVAEAVAHAFSSVVVLYMSNKKGFASGFITCAISCIIVMFAEMTGVHILIPIGVLGAKAGISLAFCFLYFSQVKYFSSAYLGLMFGSSNVVGRCSTILAPIVAELEDPIPMISSLMLCMIALFCSTLLEQPKHLISNIDKSIE